MSLAEVWCSIGHMNLILASSTTQQIFEEAPAHYIPQDLGNFRSDPSWLRVVEWDRQLQADLEHQDSILHDNSHQYYIIISQVREKEMSHHHGSREQGNDPSPLDTSCCTPMTTVDCFWGHYAHQIYL
jgi:hypothetical protein